MNTSTKYKTNEVQTHERSSSVAETNDYIDIRNEKADPWVVNKADNFMTNNSNLSISHQDNDCEITREELLI